jgi:hypothetical protein
VKLTDADKLILVKLAFWANGERECWHGIDGIVAAGVAGRTQVINSLKKLARIGVLTKRPRPRPEGRGRATDLIVVDPTAAKYKSRAVSAPDQSTKSGAAKYKSTPQQSTDSDPRTNRGTGKELERELESAAVGPRERRLPLPSIDGLKVTEAELALAAAALAKFNECNGSRLRLLGRANRATDSLTRIVMRLREHEDLAADDLRQIIERNFENPWWKEAKLGDVGPIFGPKVWGRAMANDGVPESSRTVRRGIDRRGAGRKGPDW